MPTQFENCGYAPIVLAPFKPTRKHESIPVGNTHKEIVLGGEDCTMVLLQSSGTGAIRITFDGTKPTSSKGFVLTSTMSPLLINLCGKLIIKFIGNKGNGCVLEYQIGE